LENEGRIKKF